MRDKLRCVLVAWPRRWDQGGLAGSGGCKARQGRIGARRLPCARRSFSGVVGLVADEGKGGGQHRPLVQQQRQLGIQLRGFCRGQPAEGGMQHRAHLARRHTCCTVPPWRRGARGRAAGTGVGGAGCSLGEEAAGGVAAPGSGWPLWGTPVLLGRRRAGGPAGGLERVSSKRGQRTGAEMAREFEQGPGGEGGNGRPSAAQKRAHLSLCRPPGAVPRDGIGADSEEVTSERPRCSGRPACLSPSRQASLPRFLCLESAAVEVKLAWLWAWKGLTGVGA